MRLELNMSQAEINSMNNQIIKDIDRQTLGHLKQVCELAITLQRAKIRADGGYNDQTGQLRSSTGYIIYKDGQVMHEDFQLAPYGTDKAPGLKEGKDLAFAQHRESEGWGIVMVAGMEYAEWVEAKGLSVIKDATHGLDTSIQEAFSKISHG